MHASGSPLAGLPRPPAMFRPLTPLLGREDDVAEVVALWLDPDARLVTLTGPGGVGKTRLALAVVDRVSAGYPDGAVPVDLAGVADSSLVAASIAAALGVREVSTGDVEETLTDWLADRRLLLLLDNFEQVADAAPFVARLLAACPGVDVLATSRGRLRIGGERVVEVRPLSVHSGVTAEPPPAVALFADRARAVRSDFGLTAENAPTIAAICARLDGLPLAIELAAAWSATLPPDALLARLDRGMPLPDLGARDLPKRQRTMRETVAWSEGLLSPDLQTAFRRLAVFPAGFTLDAAAAVLGDAGDDALAPVAALADRHLLRPLDPVVGQPRFGMLETIRSYARERLDASAEAADVRHRHLRWCADLVERGIASVGTAEQEGWLRRVDAEHDSMRAALAWGIEQCDPTAARLAGGMWRYWYTRGLPSEGRRWSETALAQCHGAPDADRARLLQGIGALAATQGDIAAATAVLEESRAIYASLGDAAGLATSLNLMGQAAFGTGDPARAVAIHEEALKTARSIDDGWRTTHSLNLLATALARAGQPERARSAAAEALPVARARGDRWGMALALATLGGLAAAAGNPVDAERDLGEALALQREIGDRRGTADALVALAEMAIGQGDAVTAASQLGEAAEIARGLGDRRFLARVLLHLGGALERVANDIGARANFAEARMLAAEWGDSFTLAAAERALGSTAMRSRPVASAREPASLKHDAAAEVGLTAREVDVLRLLVDGLTNREVGDRLFIGHRTVATHVLNILGKLGVDSRTAAAAWAVRNGLA